MVVRVVLVVAAAAAAVIVVVVVVVGAAAAAEALAAAAGFRDGIVISAAITTSAAAATTTMTSAAAAADINTAATPRPSFLYAEPYLFSYPPLPRRPPWQVGGAVARCKQAAARERADNEHSRAASLVVIKS